MNSDDDSYSPFYHSSVCCKRIDPDDGLICVFVDDDQFRGFVLADKDYKWWFAFFVIDVDDDGCWWLGSVLIDNDDNDLNYCWRRW